MTRIKSIICFITLQTPIILFGQKVIEDSLRLERILNNVKIETFNVSNEKKDIPKFIKRRLSKIDKCKFKIANAGGKFNSGDALQKKSLPNKRIVYIAYNENFYIITYEEGGFGRTYNARLIEYNKRTIKCITTLIMPSHFSVGEFRRILDRRDWLSYVSEKSTCF
jgi:hypothetical protein